MPPVGRLVSVITALLAAVLLVGLFARKRADACASFTAYVASALVGHALLAAFPTTFWTWEFWLATDVIQAALCVLAAFEIAYSSLRPLPRGYRKVRWSFAVLTLGIVGAVFLIPGETKSAFALTLIVARVLYGAGILFAAFFAVTEYHNVPLDPVQRDIALGFGVVTVVVAFAAVLQQLDPILGWGRNLVVKWSYLLLLAWWAQRAWGEEPPTALSRETMELLQPWRVKRIRWK